ncbi:hypothetical protein FACS1894187_07500 [Synergistales bacterium]|nr:hypothetical protein FACS1894187_07500 [Synergistales bacterium]
MVFWLCAPLVGVSFVVRDGLVLPEASENKDFMASFGAFLQGGESLPVYDHIARVYRKEMQLPVPAPAAELKLPDMADGIADGIALQIGKSSVLTDSETLNKAYSKAHQEGFEISMRNTAQSAEQSPAALDERSGIVSRSRFFAELLNESDGGILPRMSGRGLELLFWTKRAGAGSEIVGCSVRMDALRGRIADVLPAVLSEARILTVLDDMGEPLVAPPSVAAPEWRRPFVAREISPLLPRWEVGVWLANPAALTSRVRFATLAVWVLVAALFFVIVVGSAAVLWILGSEMRVAAQKTTFVANVSHELKTPLTSIRLFAELLLSGKQGNEEKRREYLHTMMSEVDRLARLIDNVLAASKREKENYPMQPLSLSELARDTAEQLKPHLEKSGFAIVLECDESSGALDVWGNREALRQVIMNLLSNAEKYSNRIREIRLSCGDEGKMAVLEVADRGIGVEPRFTDRIFREFFRADDSLSASKSGAGLGLAIARKIAHRHGGDVTYAPRPGGGSLFSLRLPLFTNPKEEGEEDENERSQ